MTTSDFRKAFTQLNNKPNVKKKYLRLNSPKKRSCGKSLKKCRRCGRNGAFIQKYGLRLCRQCFREIAQNLGFKKYN